VGGGRDGCHTAGAREGQQGGQGRVCIAGKALEGDDQWSDSICIILRC